MSRIPKLDKRFLSPDGWMTGRFINAATGHDIHYGYVFPAAPFKAVIVCLGGLSEYSEKYFEVAHDMLDRGHAFFIMDWYYQGRSGRMDITSQRRHSDGFDKDISDFENFVLSIVKPLAKDRPLVMIGHSMGGHMGLRFLLDRPRVFAAAAFSAPFLGIYNFGWPLRSVAAVVSRFRKILEKRYVFFGKDWDKKDRIKAGLRKFSGHPARNALHDAWLDSDPDLRVGSVTFGWVLEALDSCALLAKPECAAKIDIPVLLAIAGGERIVDNRCTRAFAAKLPNVTFLEFPDAGHEILMETDDIRNRFLAAFDDMIGRL